MFESDPYSDDRWVACRHCDFGGDLEIHMVSYGDVETGEWDCPGCEGYNEYRNDLAYSRADEYHDMMKEGW
jgi:hypothetical protein